MVPKLRDELSEEGCRLLSHLRAPVAPEATLAVRKEGAAETDKRALIALCGLLWGVRQMTPKALTIPEKLDMS